MPLEPGIMVRTSVLSLGSLLVLSGCIVYPVADGDEGAGSRWFELWMTDATADLAELNVGFSYVLVNEQRLELDQTAMDLLAHNGPEEGLRIASGWIGAKSYDKVVIVFSDASALINGSVVAAAIPAPVLELRQNLDMLVADGKALLVDINVSKSFSYQDGVAVFAPTAESIYLADVDPGLPDEPPIFRSAMSAAQALLREVQPSITADLRPALGIANDAQGAAAALVDQLGGVQMDPIAVPFGMEGWFVQFIPGLTLEQQAIIVEAHGASPIMFFGALPGAYVWANASQAAFLALSPLVTYVEQDRPIEWLLASSRNAIRLPDLSAPVIGLKDPAGNPLDGRGVGVAVIDIGIDATHPDLPYKTPLAINPLVLANYKVESIFQIDIPNTDTSSGHGTHVASILAGRGALDPTMKGVAPGVGLYGFGVGEASTTLWTTQALDWIAQNHDQVSPPIKVVSNSWQTSASYDPNSLTSRLVARLVDEGVTVVFAAGNKGTAPNGAAATSGECQHPREGVICVAAYDDLNTGSRSGNLASYSSRGAPATPSTWPDISAPGTSVRAASPMLGYVTGTNIARYTVMDGTSMAAPHVSGVIALMLQADASLSPAQIETLLEATAHHFADGGSYASSSDARYNGSHHAKGHGLLDAYAAVAAALL
jgi:serine protease AprX